MPDYNYPVIPPTIGVAPTTLQAINGEVEIRPTWTCGHVETTRDGMFGSRTIPCSWSGPWGSPEQKKHETAHARKKPTAAEKKAAEDFQARAGAIWRTEWPCEKCGDTIGPGVHMCRGTPGPVGQVLPHEAAVQSFVKRGLREVIAELDNE